MDFRFYFRLSSLEIVGYFRPPRATIPAMSEDTTAKVSPSERACQTSSAILPPSLASSGVPPPPNPVAAAVEAPSPGAPAALFDSTKEARLSDITYNDAWAKATAASEPPRGSSPAFARLWEQAFSEVSHSKPKVRGRRRVTTRHPATPTSPVTYTHDYIDDLVPGEVTIGEIIHKISEQLAFLFDATVGKFDELACKLQDRVDRADKLSDKAGWAEILSIAKANLLSDLILTEGKERQAATFKSLDIVMKAADAEMKRQIGDLLAGKGSETQLDLLTKLRDARDRLEKERKIFSTPSIT
jgi:hypothetical protein